MAANISELDFDALKIRCLEALEAYTKKVDTQQLTWYGYKLKDADTGRLAFINSTVFVEDSFDHFLGAKCKSAAAVCHPVGALQLVVMYYCEQRKSRSRTVDKTDVILHKDVIALGAKKPIFFCLRQKLQPVVETVLQKIFRTNSIQRLGLQGKHLPSLALIALNGAPPRKLCHYPDKEDGPQTLAGFTKSDQFTSHVHIADAEEKRKREILTSKVQSDSVLKVDHLQIKVRKSFNLQNGKETGEKELIISTPSIISNAENLIREDLVVKPIPPYLTSFLSRGTTNTKLK